MVQWLRFHTSNAEGKKKKQTNAEGMGSVLGWGTKMSYPMNCGQKIFFFNSFQRDLVSSFK